MTRKKALGAPFPRSARFGPSMAKEKKKIPGPERGHVEAGEEVNNNFFRTPKYRFGTSTRGLDRSKENDAEKKHGYVPGPGSYEPKNEYESIVAKSPNFSFQPRRDEAGDVPSCPAAPGPGHYAPALVNKEAASKGRVGGQTSRAYTFSMTKREICKQKLTAEEIKKRDAKTTPGPGHYSSPRFDSTGHGEFAEGGTKWTMPGRPDLEFGAFSSPEQGWV
eukprot:TRINITY_DN34824_c0_g1_i2.p1 TRINITY_DN34824_c0_g1~~TRINITY_DN34824_c0_g1_i2.p1  ORF type:complete len:220 (-),score=47.15 TRINITY_DN34824_c0_g1_i2:227-886(-)